MRSPADGAGPRQEFDQFVADSVDGLLRAAYLIAWDFAEAEDLVQECLGPRGRPLAPRAHHGAPDRLRRKVLVNLALDEGRRRTRRRAELAIVRRPPRGRAGGRRRRPGARVGRGRHGPLPGARGAGAAPAGGAGAAVLRRPLRGADGGRHGLLGGHGQEHDFAGARTAPGGRGPAGTAVDRNVAHRNRKGASHDEDGIRDRVEPARSRRGPPACRRVPPPGCAPPTTTPASTGSRAPVLGAGALAGAATVGTVLAVVLGGSAPAYAGWSAAPTLCDGAVLVGRRRAARASWRPAGARRRAASGSGSWQNVLTDVRGPFTVALFQDDGSYAACFTSSSFTEVNQISSTGGSGVLERHERPAGARLGERDGPARRPRRGRSSAPPARVLCSRSCRAT